MFGKYVLLALLVLGLASCQAAPAALAIPTPLVWEIASTPSLGWLTPGMNQCLQSSPEYAISYSEYPALSLMDHPALVALRWGATEDLQQPAFELGTDHLVFIVHPENPLDQIKLEDLQSVFSGDIQRWQDTCPECTNLPVGDIELWTYAPGDDVQNLFEETILSETRISTGAYLAASPSDVLKAVDEDPLAIGYLPAAWLTDSSLQELIITNLSISSLTRPILAILTSQPSVDLNGWLTCLSQTIP